MDGLTDRLRQALGRLTYRTRLTVAIVGAALVPLLVLALSLGGLAGLLRGEADRRLAGTAAVAAGELQAGTLDSAGVTRLATRTGLAVALYDADGMLLTSSGDKGLLAGVLPPSLPHAGVEPLVVHHGGLVSTFAVITGSDGSLRGYLELASPEAGLIGAGFDVGTLGALAIGFAAALAVLMGWVVARLMVRPLAALSAALGRLGTGDRAQHLAVEGSDELAALAAGHNRLADVLAARNRSLGLVLGAIAELTPDAGVDALLTAAPPAAAKAFGFTEARVELASPDAPFPSTVVEDRVPGLAWTFPTLLRVGAERLGTLWTTVPPTHEWARADQDLLELFSIELAAAIRNAQLFAEVQRLSEVKSEFLRGVSHNLQTPLTSIRAIAAQLAEEQASGSGSERASGSAAAGRSRRARDRRLAIIVEQSERLSRLVEQLLTVSRLEAGTLRPKVEVFAPGTLVTRAWESLRQGEDGFALRDEAQGWLATADQDRVDQVVWALLDNALKYGSRPIEVTVRTPTAGDALPPGDWLVVAIRDHGPGIAPEHRARAFERFARLAEGGVGGSGLGLSVARGLVEAMGGRLWIGDTDGPGSTFEFSLPAERIEEA